MTRTLPNLKLLATQRVPNVQPSDLTTSRRWLGYPRYWRWQSLGWLLLLLSQTLPFFITPSDPLLVGNLLLSALFFVLCLGSSHLVRGILIGLRARRLTWAAVLFYLLPWLALFSIIVGYVICAVGVHVQPTEFFDETLAQSRSQQFLSCVIFVANGAILVLTFWVICYFAHHLFAAYQHAQMERLRLEVSTREAELRHLRRQMDPHFLFNSLNTVRALISPENQEARGALTHLSELLRNSLCQGEKSLISLKDELAALASLLAIEQLRFGPRLQVSMRLTPGLEACLVPPFLIQTLVENAIKHGISKREQGGKITINLYASDTHLCCIVRNPGTLDVSQSGGLGLVNIRARLDHLYQEAACFSLIQSRPNHVRAAFQHPLTSHESTSH
jgi:sensor histidine kinase YesM